MLEMYAAIWRVSGGRQIVLIALSLAVAGLAAVPLKYQKDIVNELTRGALSAPELYRLGAEMMAVILLSLALKWLVSYRSGVLGEDIIRLLRQRVYARAVAWRREAGEEVPQGTLSTAVSAEAEELGKFTGGAFSDPVVQIGTLISVVGFIAATQPGLGAIALAVIVPQVVVVLATQQKVNALVARRVRILRSATNHMISGSGEADRGEIEEEFDAIFDTRRRMFVWKLTTKFAISSFTAAGTVAVLMLGGWMVLEGRTDVGTVVAATIGLGRIQGPTAFLIAFYRQVSANRIKFELLREVLQPDADPARR